MSSRKKKYTLVIATGLGLAVATLFFLNKSSQKAHADDIIASIVASEEFMENQRKPLKNFALALMTTSEPMSIMPDLFASGFEGNGLTVPHPKHSLTITGGSISDWSAEPTLTAFPSGKGWKPLLPLFSGNEDYDFIKAYMIKGHFMDNGQFQSVIGLQGRIRPRDNTPWQAFRSKHTVTWITEGNPQIIRWKIDKFSLLQTPIRVFEEVTDQVIPDSATRKEVKQSMHEEYFINGHLGKPVSLYQSQTHLARYLDRDALTLHPGLAVVDYDGDGWEDLYLTVRQGRNILLKNQGNGTFRDATVEAKLAVPGLSNAALFADFDNDGDPDLFLARTLKPSLYFQNNDGVFEECSKTKFNLPLPQLANSVTAVDYNQDGLLDIYVSTYGMFGSSSHEVLESNKPFMTEKAYLEYANRLDKAHRYLNMVGPPNVLLVNRGEKGFELAPENSSLEYFTNSFQASWSDFDDDGDPDLYIANDFAPDILVRNDGKDENGIVRFSDVTAETGHPAMLGFGMGVDWGDYDRDGKEDLYVSNMFSKAGLRITEQVPNLDLRFRQSAEGNRLYRYDGKSFQLTSRPAAADQQVEQAGWSWGGQFFDANNDGWLDIYTANGYYTAPPELSNEADG